MAEAAKSKKIKTKKRSGKQGPAFPLPLLPDDSARPRTRRSSTRWSEIRRMPNPWPPSDIVSLLTLVCGTSGSFAIVVYKIIKLWIEHKAAQKIRIKKGDVEIEIQGGMSVKTIEKRINEFQKLTDDLDEEKVKIILPPGVKRDIPPDLINKIRGELE